jgi:hypothetical protein
MFATIAFANGLNVKPFAHSLSQGGQESIVSLNWLVHICLNLPLVAIIAPRIDLKLHNSEVREFQILWQNYDLAPVDWCLRCE